MFFLVYDPPVSNGPYLIGQHKGSKDKTFPNYSRALHRHRQLGTAVRNVTKIHEFDNLADATGYCVYIREMRVKAAAARALEPLPDWHPV